MRRNTFNLARAVMHVRWSSLAAAIAIVGPMLWCFGSTLSGARVFAYRDTAHFYYPLYHWTQQQFAQGELPLWNPQDNNGIPVVAQPTSALFYPGRLVFALPVDFAIQFNLYILVHVSWAAWGAYILARRWNAPPSSDRCSGRPRTSGHASATVQGRSDRRELSAVAAGLAAVAYTLGGVVLFQYCNVVFLVGAAWLPFACLAVHRMLSRRSLTWSLGLGVCLAMMVLGGDPQSAYHAGLLAILYVILHGSVSPHGANDSTASETAGRSGRRRIWACLAVAATSGVLLSAVQIVPAWSWTRGSDRAVYSLPRNIYEIPPFLRRPANPERPPSEALASGWSGVAQGLLGEPALGEHHRQLYSFSLAPWRLVEAVWPNWTGRTFPVNRRWLSAVGGEDRIWTPSLYLGILPLLLGLRTWRLRGRDRRIRWLSWVALLFVVGSFGWYGPGLALQQVRQLWSAGGESPSPGAPTGGLYWLMVVTLPGYAYFRFPAKLLVVASLAMAQLAAVGLDQVLASDRRRFSRWLAVTFVLSVGGGLLALVSRPWWEAWCGHARPDELFGPLNIAGAWHDTWMACGHTALVCLLAWWLLVGCGTWRHATGALLLLLTATELAWSNGWMVLTAPQSAMQSPSVLSALAPSESLQPVYRWPHRRWVPEQWTRGSSISRPEETLRWDVATLYAKFFLLGPHRSVHSRDSISSFDYQAVVGPVGDAYPDPALLRILGARYLILPAHRAWPGARKLDGVPTAACDVAVWYDPDCYPRSWIVHHAEQRSPFRSSDPRAIRQHVRDLLFENGQPRDLRRVAIVETADAVPASTGSHLAAATAAEMCRVTHTRPTRVDIDATLEAPGWVVVNQLYDPGWTVEVETRSSPRRRGTIVRVNRIMQGVFLPAGQHHLVLRYAPRGVYLAGAVSLLGWLATIIAALVAGIKVRGRSGRNVRSRRSESQRRGHLQIW